MARKYLISMSGTFRSFVQGKITLEELQAAYFVFGPHKDGLNEQSVPSFVMSHNVEKPKWVQEAEYVDNASLDKPVLEQWQTFRAAMKIAAKEERITWTDAKNYPSKIRPLLQAGHEVFWDGQWRKTEEFNYMGDA